MKNEMRQRTVWNGNYRDINYEIQNFKIGGLEHLGCSEQDCWTFYLYIKLDAIPEEYIKSFWLDAEEGFNGRVSYPYSNSKLADLDWHCGITWYSKEGGLDGNSKAVKIGCDYQHYLDEGSVYDVEYVQNEAIACIDSLWEMFPNMKIWCSGCGKYYKPEEGCTCIYYKKPVDKT